MGALFCGGLRWVLAGSALLAFGSVAGVPLRPLSLLLLCSVLAGSALLAFGSVAGVPRLRCRCCFSAPVPPAVPCSAPCMLCGFARQAGCLSSFSEKRRKIEGLSLRVRFGSAGSALSCNVSVSNALFIALVVSIRSNCCCSALICL